MQLTPHFSLDELTIRGGVKGKDADKVTPAVRTQLERLCAVLELIRAKVGEPLHITSGFRAGDPKQHGAGMAADVQVRGMSPLDLVRLIHEMASSGVIDPRQVIAESLHTSTASLSSHMDEGSGLWVHVAIYGPGYGSTAARWLTSVAPVSGERVYKRWTP